jgi:hypothetical protein
MGEAQFGPSFAVQVSLQPEIFNAMPSSSQMQLNAHRRIPSPDQRASVKQPHFPHPESVAAHTSSPHRE